MKYRLRSVALSVVTAFGVAGCGGGGDGGGSDLAGGGSTGTGISYGTITGFGSVIVNGVKYNTDAATILLDDNPGVEDNLRVGMAVRVEGTVNDDGTTGAATKIEFNDLLEGTVGTPPNLTTNTLVAMGQTVKFDNLTVFEDKVTGTTGTLVGASASVIAGNVIEVSGWLDDSGAVRASRVERKAASFTAGELELKGTIANLNDTAKTFTIGGLTIDYASATSIEGTLINGVSVEIKSTQALSGTTMTASKVVVKSSPFADVTSGRLEIEGYVTALTTSDEFAMGSQRVKTSASTVFENGTAANIAVGTKLEVKGTMSSSGVLNATKVSIRLPNNIEIEATVDAVDANAKTVTLLGVAVQMTSATQFEDDSNAKLRPFSLANLSQGDYVEMKGYLKDGKVTASRLARDDLDSDILLQGVVSVKAGDLSTLTILGITVDTGAGAVYRLVSDGPAVTRAAFFDAVSADSTLVKAKGTWNGSSLTATEVEIEI